MTATPTAPPQQWPSPDWGQLLFAGAAGTLLLHVERSRHGMAAQQDIARWAAVVCRDGLYAHPDMCGLYRGVPSVVFALHGSPIASHQYVLEKMDVQLGVITRLRLRKAYARMEQGTLPALAEFDLIRGLTGLGICAMRRGDRELLKEVLAYLVALTESVRVDGETLPGWWTMHDLRGRLSDRFPGGHGNLGMAHGIAGPLALLATASIRGVSVPGQRDAMRCIERVFDRFRCDDSRGCLWPGFVRRSEWLGDTVVRRQPERPSWCYGWPGMIRALQLSAMAGRDLPRLFHLEQVFANQIANDAQLALLQDPFLCHGWAGLLHSAQRFVEDAIHVDLRGPISYIRSCFAASLQREVQGMSAGLLEGQVGLELAQLSWNDSTDATTCWDNCLLVSG